MADQILTSLTQFGAAGLIGVLWLFERRQAGQRERQLEEAHRRLLRRERELDALLRVVQENTRAINALEHSQRRLMSVLRRRRRRPRPAPDQQASP